MAIPKICLCLTASTLAENLKILNTYRKWVDMVELRVDYLSVEERLHIRRFPEMAGIPVILTIRRVSDGGIFREGEASRTTLFARGLAFADPDFRKNFAFVDLEDDLDVPSIQDAALAFGTRIIRSYHCMNDTVIDIPLKMAAMRRTGYEIPKVACMPYHLSDVTRLFKESESIDYGHIICAMGIQGLSTRILAGKLGSFLTYCSPANTESMSDKLAHVDPILLNEVYNFRTIDDKTEIFGVTGYPLSNSSSPQLHNDGYHQHGLNAVYIAIRAETIEETIEFAEQVGVKGISVTVPHKETVIDKVQVVSEETAEIGACNTILKTKDGWSGFNTDIDGFKRSLLEFLGREDLLHKKIAIIGAGGVARAVANVVHELHGKACIFNRTIVKARILAEKYDFSYAALGLATHHLLERYSWLIIQTTSLGMGWTKEGGEGTGDPLDFYNFQGHEQVYDVTYYPKKTPIMLRAEEAGCRISNGYDMLKYQAYKQFELFTGVKYE